MGVKGSFKNLETSRRSLTGVLSLIGSRAIIRRPEDDLGFSVISEDEGAKRPLEMANKRSCRVDRETCLTLEVHGFEDPLSACQINQQKLDRPPARPDCRQDVS